jgi:pSer/pThr/pTyr-binding forkhead associated (FHA) protein
MLRCAVGLLRASTHLMPYLQLNNTQFPLFAGETRVGRGTGADVRVFSGADEVDAVIAVITVEPNLSASVRRESDTASIAVNGIALGSQPSPLFHGDRLNIDDAALVFGEETHAGHTMQVSAVEPGTPRPGKVGSRGGRTGGRLVSLMDGREYTVGPDGLTMGREPGCDVVVTATDVSRRHARIELKPEGYTILDTSTNGILVNGGRVPGAKILARGDTIQIGPEEFRFHADVEPPPPPPPPPVILATPPESALSARDSALGTRHSALGTQTSTLEPRTANPEPRTPHLEPRTSSPETRTPSPDPRSPIPEKDVPRTLLGALLLLAVVVVYLVMRSL